MHKYLGAIGFKHVESKKQLNKLLEYTETTFQWEKTAKIANQLEVSERVKHFTKDMGLMICGTYDQEDNYEREYYIPFLEYHCFQAMFLHRRRFPPCSRQVQRKA